jgi:CRISPR-associated protein Csm2
MPDKFEFNRDWISKGIQDEKPIEWAEGFADHLAKAPALTTSQLRRFFGQLKRIQAIGYDPANPQQLLMLKPQLAYAVGRAGKGAKIEDFANKISEMISEVVKGTNDEGKKRFTNFISLTEAIVAYHKAAGGK